MLEFLPKDILLHHIVQPKIGRIARVVFDLQHTRRYMTAAREKAGMLVVHREDEASLCMPAKCVMTIPGR